MPIPCPAPGSGHEPIPDGDSAVATLVNVINHLAENDRVYLEARCHQLLVDLGVERPGAKPTNPVSSGNQ